MAPRGVRNHNPGNIDRTGVAWQGEDRSAAACGRESRFCVFTSAEFGFRALARVLLTYQLRHGLHTVDAIIRRWAPPHENNTGAYAGEVAKAVGVAPDAPLDVKDANTLFRLAKAIARHENGGHYWSDAVISKGIAMAGLAPAKNRGN